MAEQKPFRFDIAWKRGPAETLHASGWTYSEVSGVLRVILEPDISQVFINVAETSKIALTKVEEQELQ